MKMAEGSQDQENEENSDHSGINHNLGMNLNNGQVNIETVVNAYAQGNRL